MTSPARIIDFPLPLHPPALSGGEADALHRLAGRRTPLRLVIGGRAVTMSVDAVTLDPSPQPTGTMLDMRLGDEPCRLHLPEAVIRWLVQPLGLEQAIAHEAPVLRDLLVEYAALDIIDRIEERAGSPLTFGGEPGDAAIAISLRIEADTEAFEVRLDLTPALADALAEHLERHAPPAPADMAALPVLLSVEAGTQDLTLAELASLAPGDVVMLATVGSRATLPGDTAAPLDMDEGIFRLSGPFTATSRRHDLTGKDRFMHARPQAGLEALPLTVVFEHGALTMTLAEVGALAPGAVLRLPPDRQDRVAIVVNGVQIGTGELVTIGEGTGVRVLGLSGTPDAGAAPRG